MWSSQLPVPALAVFLATCCFSGLGFLQSQDKGLGLLNLFPGLESNGLLGELPPAVCQCASAGPLLLCWGHMIVPDGNEWWAEDFGRVRPNPCVAPGTRIKIAGVIAHALLRIKSQLSGKLWSSMTRTARDTVPFLEVWSVLPVYCSLLGFCDIILTWARGSPSLVYTPWGRDGFEVFLPRDGSEVSLVWVWHTKGAQQTFLNEFMSCEKAIF